MANYFDINGDGRITAEDFQMAALMRGHSSLGSQVKAKAAFKMLDTNGNGMLNGNEAFGLFRNMPGNYAGCGDYIKTVTFMTQNIKNNNQKQQIHMKH